MKIIFVIVFLFTSLQNANAQVEDSTCNLPNAFSPNNDGKNDTWDLSCNIYVDSFRVAVYSRWGETIFATNDIYFSWNGKNNKGQLQSNGMYVYKMCYYINKQKINKTGYVTIL